MSLQIRLGFVVLLSAALAGHAQKIGQFDGQSDVGSASAAAPARFDAAADTYIVSGRGSNMWFGNDAFHFVWKKLSGDVRLTADVKFAGTALPPGPHSKACLIFRQSLASDSVYADAALHSVGLTCLQFRETNGALTREIIANVSAPERLGLVKRGDYIYMLVGSAGEKLHPAGGEMRLRLADPFYVGLGVCAHNDAKTAVAEFSHVEVTSLPAVSGAPSNAMSTLETIDLHSRARQVIYNTTDHIEAPNWTRDGRAFIFNRSGHLWRLPVKGSEPVMIDTGFAHRCNNDHGLSPDGTELAISDQSQGGASLIYLLPAAGGTPRRITSTGPSYWHGWSPDGQTLAFCGERDGNFDIYTISTNGGVEKRLTTAPGLDDGPDYSPDGKYIYFNSARSGLMQIWRMKPDGSDQEQVTDDDQNNWFAHPSPDGRWIVFLSFPKDVTGHPANKDVTLRMMPANGGPIETLASFFGGQGTINVPSWSPDSRKVAFVSYLPKE